MWHIQVLHFSRCAYIPAELGMFPEGAAGDVPVELRMEVSPMQAVAVPLKKWPSDSVSFSAIASK